MSLRPEFDSANLLVLVGPTAVGKTAAALALARIQPAEIVNADSMQVYRGMDIGTAKPTAAERAEIPFHLLDLVDPDQPFTVADWKARAEESIADIQARGRLPIVCGGTGLYIRALLDDWTLAETPADRPLRTRLQARLAHRGPAALHEELRQVDPVTAARLHPNDVVRVIRALEVFETTGQPISVHQQQDRAARRRRPARQIGLTLPRPLLYERIEQRVVTMLENGLENEVRRLLQQGYAPTLAPLRGLGYKELVQCLAGELDYPGAVHAIQQNTRRFAKRQQTWFRADPTITWLDVSALDSATVASQIHSWLEREKLADVT